MPHVIRDANGKITGFFAVPQEGQKTEFLPDHHPDVVSFVASMRQPSPVKINNG